MKPSEISLAIEETAINDQQPLFIWGPPGVGKSDTVASTAKRLKHQLIDKRMAQSDSTELKGYPWPNAEAKVMTFLQDGELPTKGKGILFLDEINHAPQLTQAACFQLILDRRIGSYKLPDGWVVVAAGNRASDRSAVHAMSAPLANRFIHVDYEVDVDEWLKWAFSNGLTSTTRGYIQWRPANLMQDKLEAGVRAFPSPRSWSYADRIMRNPRYTPDMKRKMLVGAVGEGIGIEYFGFVQEAATLPDLKLIQAKPETAPIPDSPATCHALIAALDNITTVANLPNLMTYISRLSKEFEVVYVQTLARRDDTFLETPTLISWIRDNRDIIL